MTFRDANASDATAIAYLHAESWRSAYRGILSDSYLENDVHEERRNLWQQRFSAESTLPMFVLVAEIEGRIAGFACVFPDSDAMFGSLVDNLHVSPMLTGQGIGKRLLSGVAGRLHANGSRRGLYLWVIEQNLRARRFYEKAGAMIVDSEISLMPDGTSVVEWRCYWPNLQKLLQ